MIIFSTAFYLLGKTEKSELNASFYYVRFAEDVISNFLGPCDKKYPKDAIKAEKLKTIEQFLREDLVQAILTVHLRRQSLTEVLD